MTQSTLPPRTDDDTMGLGLAEAVRRWAEVTPSAPACTYVDYGQERSGVARTWTYAELDARANGVGAALREISSAGDRVAVLVPHRLEYLAALLGCLYTGRLAVPLLAPEPRRPSDRIVAAVADARPSVTLLLGADRDRTAEVFRDEVTAGTLLLVDELPPAASGEPVDGASPEPDDVAYLQYTSGSTRRPAGVMVTHRNLATGSVQLRSAFGVGDTGTTVSWLPFFHDMGLLFGVAAPLQAGGHAVYLSPFAFVQRPVRWLRLITEHRATTTASPNFGLDSAVRRVTADERASLDLSPLAVLANGAEPIRARTLHEFTAAYRPHGFRPEAHRPGYGLAEATLVVTVSVSRQQPLVGTFDRAALAAGQVRPASAAAGDVTTLVGCGVPWQQQVRIVDPVTARSLDSDQVGEVWVHGVNVCCGYFGQPDESAAVFTADLVAEPAVGSAAGTGPSLPSETPGADIDADSRGWLRTGDLGFFHEGVLYLTSRLKDLVIINGRNHYPIDLEATVEGAVPQARTGHVAAFSVDMDGFESLVVVIEIEPRHVSALDVAAARLRVRAALSRVHEVEPHAVILARPGAIPKTTSGKLQRRACRDRYLAGELPVLAAADGASQP